MADTEKKRNKRASKKASKIEAGEIESELSSDLAETHDAPLSQEASEDQALGSIEWNKKTAGLQFEELARRVADTVSENESLLHDVVETAAFSGEEADAEAVAGSETEFQAETDASAMDLGASADLEVGVAIDSDNLLTAADHDLSIEPETSPDDMEQMGFSALEEELDAAENDASPEPTEFIETDQLISIIESLLFSTDKPVSVATIKQVFKGSNVRSKDIMRALDSLASDYASSVRGVSLEEINGGYQMRTKPDNMEFLRRLAKVRPFRLSGPALEAMAIIAYKQPITKHEIDEIRGVESGHLLRALMERGLVSFNGKSELPGKPMTYGSTRKFLETFGLRNIRELPTLSEIDELLPEGIGEVEERETLSDITESMSTEVTSKYSEGEDELQKINEHLQTIDITSEFFEQEKIRERERRDRDRAQDIREKLVLGDAVETKDKRWLDRYEAKLANPTAAAPGGEAAMGASSESTEGSAEGVSSEGGIAAGESAGVDTDDSGDEPTSITSELEALSEEASGIPSDDEEEIADDLDARADWDEEAEAEDHDTSNDV
jgi:segregation and condensation protein B